MTTSHSAEGSFGVRTRGLTAKRRQSGTSLVEILVVIVIFLIGILAVVQIFPGGFRLLLTTRNNSVATAIGRDEVERLKSKPEMMPEQVLPVRYVADVPQVDNTMNPLSLDAQGEGISAAGILYRGGSPVTSERDWSYFAGPNAARRIIGEGQRVPSPRRTDATNSAGLPGGDAAVMASYGGLLVLDHGPVDAKAPIVAYANELSRTYGAPRETTDTGTTVTVEAKSADGTATVGTFSGVPANSPVATTAFEFFVVDPQTPTASLYLPATYNFDRTYRLRMSAYIGGGAGYKRVDYVSLSFRVPRVAVGTSFVRIRIADLLAATPGALSLGSFGSAEPDTIRLAPQFDRVATWTSPNTVSGSSDYTPINPYEFKVIDASLGTLLFSPAARDAVVVRAGGVNEPLVARVDYDVLDWRILREDFRPTGDTSFTLALQSLKVGSQTGPDGRTNGSLWAGATAFDPSPAPADNFLLLDLTTGWVVQEVADDGTTLVSVDKSRGLVRLIDSNSAQGGAQIRIVGPSGLKADVNLSNRPLRALYRARNEWAVQLIKSASQYARLYSFPSAATFVGQFYVGDGGSGTLPSRLYFPVSDAGRKITVDSIAYTTGGGQIRSLEGQDFIIRAPKPSEPTYAYIDLREVDPQADRFNTALGEPVRGVKGASAMVRVLWNPDAFTLGTDLAANAQRANVWSRGWRRSTTETFLRAEETR